MVKKGVILVTGLLLLLFGISTYFRNSISTDVKENNTVNEAPNILDNCYHVYLDVGTNLGIQIRKLFEPEKYPEAKVLPFFESTFGTITERLTKTPDGGGYGLCTWF